MLGSERRHLFYFFLCHVVGEYQDGGVGITQLIVNIYPADAPALIWKTLVEHVQTQGK